MSAGRTDEAWRGGERDARTDLRRDARPEASHHRRLTAGPVRSSGVGGGAHGSAQAIHQRGAEDPGRPEASRRGPGSAAPGGCAEGRAGRLRRRREFTDLFADLLERTYLSRIDQYGGEKVQYVSEAIDGDNAIVRAKVITRKGAEVPVESRLLRHGDRWLMYDVLLENISLVGNYRAQFDQIIRQSSYDELAKRLRDKRSDPSRP